ncbi:DUF2971 domain-containing protein [Giesbergeria anulus]|uniref:DUF2971 domain-containing protein n=1 Tax=Giesbergeria anulus TaxID=180197 RepID=A0A1H9SLZ5_9BURK|nr:DUF2971 domain-containing protein [Giesbergeria anulus]SER85934.1 Protein of unknown function [Giesbergeria anulus]
MKLYKYYSYTGGLAAIDSRQYGFTEPNQFNDPFEITYLLDSTNADSFLPVIRAIKDLKTRVCILCLTKSPINPLMWAHYGESHKGFVVEYDVDDEFLTSTRYNIVPVQNGAVTYKSKDQCISFPDFKFDDFHQVFLRACGSDGDEINSYSKLIEYLYLTKSRIWDYEDEVRVVKLVDSLFEETHVFLDDPMRSYKILTKPIEDKIGYESEKKPGLKLFDRHQAKIESIYIGVNNSLLKNEINLRKKISTWKSQGIKNIFQVKPNLLSWSLHPVSLDSL